MELIATERKARDSDCLFQVFPLTKTVGSMWSPNTAVHFVILHIYNDQPGQNSDGANNQSIIDTATLYSLERIIATLCIADQTTTCINVCCIVYCSYCTALQCM